jgi:uncharacterized tellurite resistance protein B-like protein
MLSIRELFGLAPKPTAAAGDTHTVRKVVEALDQMDPEKARFIAAFGYILGRVAHADSHISAEETRAMERLLAYHLPELTEAQALVIVQTAKMHNQLFGATENFLVTREFARISTRQQKLELLDCLFAVSAEEDDISRAEDNEVHQIASELGLEHREYIAARSAWKGKLKLLQDLPQGPSSSS